MIQRKRGRPPGASRLNAPDGNILNRIAEIIARRSMPPTTAMRQLGIEDDATIRRLRRKWNIGGPALLQAVRARRQKEQMQAVAATPYDRHHSLAASPQVWAEMAKLSEGPLAKLAKLSEFSKAMKAFNGPWAEWAKRVEVSNDMKFIYGSWPERVKLSEFSKAMKVIYSLSGPIRGKVSSS